MIKKIMLKIKSKIFTGLMVALFVLSAVVSSNVKTASAATWMPTSATIITKKSSSANVMWLQATLNAVQNAGLAVDGVYGAHTTAAIKAFQVAHPTSGVADGIAGRKTIAALNIAGAALGGTVSVGGSFPAGCTSASGFSTTTGAPCNTGTVVTPGLPAGCVTTSGFSPVTGANCATGTTTTTTSGPLSVSLASDNPAAGNLIQGQATADLAHYMFTGTGTLSQVVLQRTGISDNSVFPNVYLYNGTTRLTDSASVNSNGQIIFNNVNVAVNGSLDLSVRADIVSSSTGVVESTVQVTLTGYTVSGGTPNTVSIPGNSFYVNSGTGVLSTVSVGNNTVSLQSISAGTTGMALWSAPVSVNLHSVWLKSAAFDVIGSAPANAFANLGLFANGVKIATSTGVNSMGYITFDLSATPYSMPTGTTTLEVRGDVVNGSSRTVQLSLQHASDLMVTDSQVGVNVGITGLSGALFSINQGGVITINQGSLVSQSDPAFNSQTNVTGGATNVPIASYKLTSYGENVKVNTVTVTPVITGAPAACNALAANAIALNNVTLYYNGAPIGSSQNATSVSGNGTSGGCTTLSTLTFTPGSNLTIAGGTTGIFQVHADLVNGAGTPQYSSGTITATVTITQFQGITSGSTGSTAALTGSNPMTIQTGSLTVSQNAAYQNQTINPNTSGAKIGSFTLQNQSTSEAVQVNSLTIGLCASATITSNACATPFTPLTNFSTLTLGGIPGTVTPVGQPTASNVFSTNFTIPAGGSQTVDIFANLGATNTGSVYTSLLPTAVGANSRVSITGTAIAGQAIGLSVGSLNTPLLVGSQSTNAQYISSGGAGAINAAQESYNFVATSGTASITGLKFAAITATTPITPTSTLVTPFTSVASSGAVLTASTAGFNVGDNVLVTTTGIYGGQNAVGTVTAIVANTSITINVTTPMIVGAQTVGGSAGVVGSIYQLATSGATGVTLNSPGLATGSATFNGGIAYISAITGATGTTGVMVPNTPSGVTVPVFVSFGAVNNNGGVASGTVSQILLEYVQYQTGSSTSYVAPTAATATGTTITLVGSKPNITLNPSTQALTNGTSVLVGTVTIAADNSGDIAISKIPLTVSLSSGTGGAANIVANGVVLTDTNGAALANLTSTNAGGAVTSTTASEVFGSATANHYRISAGSSKTFEIHVNFTGATMGTSASASVSLGAPAQFVWDDINGANISNVATNGTITSGLSGAALYSYPSGSVSIH